MQMKKKVQKAMNTAVLSVLLLAGACSREVTPAFDAKKADQTASGSEAAHKDPLPQNLAKTRQMASAAPLKDQIPATGEDLGDHPQIREKLGYLKSAYAEPIEFAGAQLKSSATLHFTYNGIRLKFMYDFLGRLFALEMSAESGKADDYRDLILSTMFLDEVDLTQAQKEDFVMSLVISGQAQQGELTGTYRGNTAWFSFR